MRMEGVNSSCSPFFFKKVFGMVTVLSVSNKQKSSEVNFVEHEVLIPKPNDAR